MSVSVILPAKGECPFLTETMESLARQTLRDFEIVVVDDGMSDAARAVASGEKVVLIPSEGAGLVDALNTGIKHARYGYIARMDADDIARADRLERQASFLDQTPDAAIVGSSICQFGWSPAMGFHPEAEHDIHFPLTPDLIAESLRSVERFWVLAHPSIMARKAAFLEVGGYHKTFLAAEDLDLWVRLSLKGHKFYNIDDTLLRYRSSSSSVSGSAEGRILRYLSTALLISYARARHYPERFPTDPLSIDTFMAWSVPGQEVPLLTDFAILLRGVAPDERTRCYHVLAERHADMIRAHARAFSDAVQKAEEARFIARDVRESIDRDLIARAG